MCETSALVSESNFFVNRTLCFNLAGRECVTRRRRRMELLVRLRCGGSRHRYRRERSAPYLALCCLGKSRARRSADALILLRMDRRIADKYMAATSGPRRDRVPGKHKNLRKVDSCRLPSCWSLRICSSLRNDFSVLFGC